MRIDWLVKMGVVKEAGTDDISVSEAEHVLLIILKTNFLYILWTDESFRRIKKVNRVGFDFMLSRESASE